MMPFFDNKPMTIQSQFSQRSGGDRTFGGIRVGVLALLGAIALWLCPSPALAVSVYNMPFVSPGEDTWILDEGKQHQPH